MRFALLGLDSDTLPIARAVRDSAAHELTLVVADVRHQLGATVRPVEEWEILLGGADAEAVVVARSPAISLAGRPEAEEAARLEQVRRLAQAGLPLLVAHPLTFNVLDAYEIEMARGESPAALVPWMPALAHRGILLLTEWIRREREHGTVSRITFQRKLEDLRLATIQEAFCRDVMVLRHLAGELTRVSTLGDLDTSEGPLVLDQNSVLTRLGVQLDGPGQVHCEWSPRVGGETALELVVVGPRSRATLTTTPDRDYELAISGEAVARGEASAEASAREALRWFTENDARCPGWRDAIRSLELTEGLFKSLRRGRTVNVSDEEATEAGAFKSTMTSAGCTLLIAALVGVVVVVGLAGVAAFAFPDHLGWARFLRIADLWPAALLAALGLFLLVQLLRFVIPKEPPEE